MCDKCGQIERLCQCGDVPKLDANGQTDQDSKCVVDIDACARLDLLPDEPVKNRHTLSEGQNFVGFIEFQGRLFAGSSRSIYEVVNNELVVLKFAPMEVGDASSL